MAQTTVQIPGNKGLAPTLQADIALQQAEQSPPTSGQRVQRIHLEDSGSSIDELRYGGETRSVTVQPKYNVPAYEIQPSDGTRRPPTVDAVVSPRVWNLLKF